MRIERKVSPVNEKINVSLANGKRKVSEKILNRHLKVLINNILH